ncbi:hypothetical protein HRG_009688 [Hirsutella rhossiliensis]|uniref:Uncharacterized protein n=1 Tax=Hirsutella rhossiliensis TaxID=111463 RepID=A0A9P8MQH5_9HYPO|nr:uncharacterized protein HRG_09688 [Hirsutella rhossiliensis]KAH0959227.1 hypothetical protein HRG_09688 [Hirsutella rhossiliensis]
MVFTTQFLTAALALLASGVRGEVGCIAGIDQSYYISPSGECCTTDYAVAGIDGAGQASNIQCGDKLGTPGYFEGVPMCNGVSAFEFQCSNGIHASLEAFPQSGRCGAEMEAPASGDRPNDEVGCYSGRVYVNAGGCCSTDYAVAERDDQGRVLKASCGNTASILAPDNLEPEHLKGVPKCNGAVDKSWCPGGMHATENALMRSDVCSGTGCCPRFREARDHDGVCRWNPLNFSNKKTSKAFWEARDRDGCTREGELGACCPDPKHFRNAKGVCSTRNSRGREVEERLVAQWRRSDGCDDE